MVRKNRGTERGDRAANRIALIWVVRRVQQIRWELAREGTEEASQRNGVTPGRPELPTH